MRRLWFVSLIDATGLHWIAFSIVFAVLLAAFMFFLTGTYDPTNYTNSVEYLSTVGSNLFFAVVNAYALGSGYYVLKRAEHTVDILSHETQLSAAQITEHRQYITGGTPIYLTVLMTMSLIGGSFHAWLLSPNPFENIAVLATSIATVFTWVVITHVISAFVIMSRVFTELGRHHLKVDLLNTHKLAPFGNIIVLPAVCLLGTQILYPLLSLGGIFNLTATLPGFLLTLGSLLYLSIVPSRALHTRMLAEKQKALILINEQIENWQQNNKNISDYANLQPLLQHRQFLEGLPTWPLNVTALAKWLFYLTIPPITWALAALMENYVDSFIS